MWGVNFTLNFSFMILTPLLPLYLSDQFGAGKDAIGLVLSGYALSTLLFCPFGGLFIESFPRKMVLLVCTALFTLLFGGYIVAGSMVLFSIIRTLHGAPMGATVVVNNTLAVEVLPESRRAEGINYYGISSNFATAIAPAIGLFIYHKTGDFQYIFLLALAVATIGFIIDCTLKLPEPKEKPKRQPITFDRLFLKKGVKEAINLVLFSFAFGVVGTYLAIYGKEILGITIGSGLFFVLYSIGLVTSRLMAARILREGKIAENAVHGVLISTLGYFTFAAVHNPFGYYAAALFIGFGNGFMYPSLQNMLINLAPEELSGTANSTMFVARNFGTGLGIVLGGVVVEYFGYDSAFWMAWIANASGVLFFFIFTRRHFLRNRLR